VDDERSCKNNKIVWDVFEGDLVQVRRYTPDGDQYFEKGIVVAEKSFDQVLLFPYVNVYV
jgi:hypothetical protein